MQDNMLIRRGVFMPINALRKNSLRGKGPPASISSEDEQKRVLSQEEKEKESELAVKEEQAMWESEEIGITRWSETDGKRFAD